MREYLFRGKEIDSGEWSEGSLWVHLGKPYIITAANVVGYEVDPETVGQYAGVNVRGEKILEGDIVKVTDKYNTSVIYIVEYFMGAFVLKQLGVDYRVQFIDFHMRHYDFEIIGNIHDNPELLREGGE